MRRPRIPCPHCGSLTHTGAKLSGCRFRKLPADEAARAEKACEAYYARGNAAHTALRRKYEARGIDPWKDMTSTYWKEARELQYLLREEWYEIGRIARGGGYAIKAGSLPMDTDRILARAAEIIPLVTRENAGGPSDASMATMFSIEIDDTYQEAA